MWRDFKPGGGTPGEVEDEELGLPGVTVELRDESGRSGRSTTTDRGERHVRVRGGRGRLVSRRDRPGHVLASRTRGVSWLGASLITPAIMIAYIWVWAGFAMVVIAAGLAAIPRDLLEAARTDGATELARCSGA